MTTYIVATLAFLGGLAIGMFGMFLSDGRYLKNIQGMYEKREKGYEGTIQIQKETIDRLLEMNNGYQIQKVQKVKDV